MGPVAQANNASGDLASSTKMFAVKFTLGPVALASAILERKRVVFCLGASDTGSR